MKLTADDFKVGKITEEEALRGFEARYGEDPSKGGSRKNPAVYAVEKWMQGGLNWADYLYETWKEGHFKLDHEIQEEAEEMTPRKGQPIPECWTLFKAAISCVPRLLVYGHPGTGKSFTAALEAEKQGFNVYSITLTPDTPAAEVRGHWILGGEGRYVWHDGPAIRAWKDPKGLLLINEIDRGSPDVQSLLYAICDDTATAHLYLPNGEDLRPSEGYRVVATTNAEPEDLPEGLRDRFAAKVAITAVHPDALNQVDEKFREAARKSGAEVDATRRFSVRSWMLFSQMLSEGKLESDIAGKLVFRDQWHDIKTALAVGALPKGA